jgi:hypothetical protein
VEEDGYPPTPTAADLDGYDREDALTALRLTLRWTMEPERWRKIEALLDSMSTSLAGGDVDRLRAASAKLLFAGPNRATKLGETPTVPAPDPIRERVNELVHALVEAPPQLDERPEPGAVEGAALQE